MSLQSLSPASSINDWDDEIPRVGSSHPVPQSLDVPPATSPTEVCAREDFDSVKPPRVLSIFNKWLQRKNNKDSTSHEPNRLSGKSRQSADRRPPRSPTKVDATNDGPSWMAAGKRKRVSTLGRRSDLVCLTYLSEWLQKPSEGQRFVVPRICIQGLVIYYRINHLPRLLFPNIRTRTPRVVDKVLRAQTQVARCVFYLVMVELATTAHVPLGATSGQFISSLSREGLSNGTRYFPLIYIVRLTVNQHQQGSGDATLSFRFLAWFF